jgi:hypothetical protein
LGAFTSAAAWKSPVTLPFTPLAATVGFVPLPGTYFVFLFGITVTYLIVVELVKRRLMRTLLGLDSKSVTPASQRPPL